MNDWRQIDELLGLRLIEETPDIDVIIYDLIKKRDVARENKDSKRNNEICDELPSHGIALNDTPNGTVWYYV